MELTAEELQAKIDEATSGAVSKNTELLDELKQAKKLNKSFEGLDLEQLKKDAQSLKDHNDNKDKESGEYKKLYDTQTSEHAKALEALKDANTALSASNKKMSKENTLNAAFTEHHVIPEMQDAARAVLFDGVALNDDGVAMVGDKTVSDHVKEWVAGEVGKRFVSNGNSGGGALGGGGGADETSQYFDPKSKHFNRTKQGEVAKKSPEEYRKYKALYK